MKLVVSILMLCAGCTQNRDADPSSITTAEAGSIAGPIAGWKLAQGISSTAMQAARDRAYTFCLDVKPADLNCSNEQDVSLISFSHAVFIWQLYRQDHKADHGYAAAHRRDPSAFRKARRYCWSTYVDNGSRDARMLGPCMLDAVGGDFFGILPVS